MRQSFRLSVLIFAMLLCTAPQALAQFIQQGPKISGTRADGALSGDGNTALLGTFAFVGSQLVYTTSAWVRSNGVWTEQGNLPTGGAPAALSADGNTALVSVNNNGVAGGLVFTRSGTTWTQQGTELLETGASGDYEGGAIALSADGNTAILGSFNDNNGIGAVWVFARSGNTWTPQGSKLVGTGEVGETPAEQGWAVALSADGNTAIVGGYLDNSRVGAAWVFTRSGSTWTQQGSKLVAGDYSGMPGQGTSVALSADGNTALVGGSDDNNFIGAAWVFTRAGTTWTEQGSKLTPSGEVGTGSVNGGQFGSAAALSSDGNTALIAGNNDNTHVGAAWVFSRTGGTWSQQGAKLVGSNVSGEPNIGSAIGLSGDGNTILLLGPRDNSTSGATWFFIRAVRTATHDFNADAVSDILWKDTSGDVAMWLMGAGQFSSGAALGDVGTSWSVAGTRDFNGDGDADILWLDNTGGLALWLMNGTSVSSFNSLGNVGTSWAVAGTGDFNGDGTGDILWRNGTTGDTAIWLMNNGAFSSGIDLGVMSADWQVAGTGDFNGDGTTDILWRDTANGALSIWLMSNGQMSSTVNVGTISTDWTVVGTGDFNGDGVSDILWRDSAGDAAIWLMSSSGQMASGAGFSGVPTPWSVAETGDFDGDGKSDILWIDTAGDLGVWLMNGTAVSSSIGLGNIGTSWTVQGQNAD